MKSKALLHGFLAEFSSPEALRRCIRKARQEGFQSIDAYTPFPVDGVEEELELEHSLIPVIVFCGGIVGLLTGVVLQYYSAVYDYPFNIGGRPLNSWPAFVIVVFELTILFAGLAAA